MPNLGAAYGFDPPTLVRPVALSPFYQGLACGLTNLPEHCMLESEYI